MSAKVDSDGAVTPLDGRTEPDEVVTAQDVQDPDKLARLLGRILKDIAALKRRWAPRHIDFELAVTGSATPQTVQLEHGFNGAVRWWVVDWSTGGTVAISAMKNTALTTTKTLVLSVYNAGAMTIRVEEAG